MLKQWIDWALARSAPPDEVWEDNGRYFDPFRPAIEPDGFDSVGELLASRDVTLQAIRRAVIEANVFVFTLGLTEAWANADTGCVYPMCPGTVRGTFDPARHEFRNFRYQAVFKDLRDTMNTIKAVNTGIGFLLTVSPVPLTATASGSHVLVATTQSKATLRAVAGDLAKRGDTDYFPSYEIITGFPFKGMFYEANLRSVTTAGVGFVTCTARTRCYPRSGRHGDRFVKEGVGGGNRGGSP